MTHAGYIIAAFGITGVVVAAMLVTLIIEHRALRRDLARFGDQGPEARS